MTPRKRGLLDVTAAVRASSWPELASAFTRTALELLECDLACASLFGHPVRVERTPEGPVAPGFSQYYDREWRAHDPILPAVMSSSEACDNNTLFEMRTWRHEPMFDAICRPSGLHHYMIVPIVGRGTIVGTLSLSRHLSRRSFRDADRVTAAALAGHASTLLAEMNVTASRSRALDLLTPIEQRTATLAADGHTVEGIALLRGVSPNTVKEALRSVYRKLNVSSRLELSRRLP